MWSASPLIAVEEYVILMLLDEVHESEAQLLRVAPLSEIRYRHSLRLDTTRYDAKYEIYT